MKDNIDKSGVSPLTLGDAFSHKSFSEHQILETITDNMTDLISLSDP